MNHRVRKMQVYPIGEGQPFYMWVYTGEGLVGTGDSWQEAWLDWNAQGGYLHKFRRNAQETTQE